MNPKDENLVFHIDQHISSSYSPGQAIAFQCWIFHVSKKIEHAFLLIDNDTKLTLQRHERPDVHDVYENNVTSDDQKKEVLNCGFSANDTIKLKNFGEKTVQLKVKIEGKVSTVYESSFTLAPPFTFHIDSSVDIQSYVNNNTHINGWFHSSETKLKGLYLKVTNQKKILPSACTMNLARPDVDKALQLGKNDVGFDLRVRGDFIGIVEYQLMALLEDNLIVELGPTRSLSIKPRIFYNLDTPHFGQMFQNTKVDYNGWLFASSHQITGVSFLVGDEEFEAEHGIERKDVVNAFKNEPFALKSGFHSSFPVREEGRHDVKLKVYFDDFNEVIDLKRSLSVYDFEDASLSLAERKQITQFWGGYFYDTPEFTSKRQSEMASFDSQPLISVIMPVYNVDPKWLELAVQSLRNQWYTNWELCIVDDKSTNESTLDYLRSLDESNLKIKFSEQNGNISVASNMALTMVEGDYVALMDNDDELTPDAFFEVVKAINEQDAEFIYSDEDKIAMSGINCNPHYKSDWNPDLCLAQNYMSHLGVIKKELITQVGGFTVGLEGAQDYDLYLKVLEHTEKIYHIPKVLYHWRMIPGSTAAEFSEKSYAQDAGLKALENAMQRRGIDGDVEHGKYPGTYRVERHIIGKPLVSIIVPFKDKPDLLELCLGSILEKTSYQNFEVIGISNNSDEAETFACMEKYARRDPRITFREYNELFNYSKINNYAASIAKGEHLLLLNNDIEVITPSWIEELLQHSQRPEVGAVGAKLYYPNDTVQHAGVICGIGGVAGHSHKYFEKENPGYFARMHLTQNLSAVTAACLMVKKSIFEQVEGLNEVDLTIAFNDVDLCLRIKELNYLNVYTPYCEMYHHESISRGEEDNPEKVKRFNKEMDYMQKRHKTSNTPDPFYNINLTLIKEDFSLKQDD